MKTLKVLSMALLVMSITLVSCSGDDGEQGPKGDQGLPGVNGIDGTNGTNGTDGQDGQDGQDGNANVRAIDFLITEFGGSSFTVNLGFTPEQMNSHAFLYYLQAAPDNQDQEFWYQVPGPLASNLRYSRAFSNEQTSDINVIFYNTSDNSIANVPIGTFTLFRVVAIEFSSLGNKNADENILVELKAAGVDTSDYDAVAAYFGLE